MRRIGRFARSRSDRHDGALFEQPLQRELQKGQHVLAARVGENAFIEPFPRFRVCFIDQTGRGRRFVHDLGKLRFAWRGEIIAPASILQRQEISRLQNSRINIGAQRGHHPYAARRGQSKKQASKKRSLIVTDTAGKNVFQLVDEQQQVREQVAF